MINGILIRNRRQSHIRVILPTTFSSIMNSREKDLWPRPHPLRSILKSCSIRRHGLNFVELRRIHSKFGEETDMADGVPAAGEGHWEARA